MFYRSLTVKSTGKTYRNGRARNACHCWCRIGIWTCFLRELDIGWRTGHRRSIEFPSGEVRANESLIPYRACGSRRRQRPCLLRRPIYARGTQRNGREKLKYHVEKKTKRVRYIATRWMCIPVYLDRATYDSQPTFLFRHHRPICTDNGSTKYWWRLVCRLDKLYIIVYSNKENLFPFETWLITGNEDNELNVHYKSKPTMRMS